MSWWDRAVVVVVCLVVCGPALFTKNGFGLDFTNHLWLVGVQTRAISANGVPTYFLNAPPVGIFYPFFMFYGGTMYAVAGALGVLLGDSGAAGFLAVCLLAVASAYGGLLWIARQLGVRGWMAHAPAITFVASAYYITNFYGRGAWPELVATSSIPLLAASALAVARAERVGAGAATLFVISTLFFAGSHNITLLLGAVFLVLVLVVLQLTLGRALWICGWRRAVLLAGLFCLGIGLNAWFLLPDIHDGAQTAAGVAGLIPWSATGFLNTPNVVFDPLRTVPKASGTPGLYVQAPDWYIAWGLLAVAALWTRSDRRLRRVAVALILLLTAILVAVLSQGVWNHLPHLIREAQFPYRANTYVALAAAGLVLVAALLTQGAASSRRGVRMGIVVGLAAATLASIALAIWQLWVPNVDFPTSYTNRSKVPTTSHVAPTTWYSGSDYSDATGPVVSIPKVTETVPLNTLNGNSATVRIDAPPASVPFTIDLAGAPYAVRVTGGVVRVGRTLTGLEVFQRTRPGAGRVEITLAPVGGAVRIGLYLTLASLAIALASLIVTLWLGLRHPVAMLARRARS